MSATCLFFLGLVGCEYPSPKALPAPLHDKVEYELEGRVRRIWGSDCFEFGQVNELHFIIIRGVDTPKPGQPYFDEAKAHLTKLVRKRIARISIVGRDSMMREFADVYSRPKPPSDTTEAEAPDSIETNVALSLIQHGFGWYDGTEFADGEALEQAELEAREKRIGLWAQDNPIPPWEFEEH